MKHTIILLFFLIMPFLLPLYGQNFKGTVVDIKGEPIPGGTLYIHKINQGLLCNEDGVYQTTLTPGSYTVSFKCLGYKTEERSVTIPLNETVTLKVALTENPFELAQVVVSSKEDPAYEIMRKAIAKAPIYAGAVEKYTADVYVKGSLEFKKISKMIDKLSESEEGVKISELKDNTFVKESYSELEYTAPNEYKQNIKASSSSFPEQFDSDNSIKVMNASLYEPKFQSLISPLNENAFSYYKFRYEGFTEDGNLSINKIKVTPKVKDPMLFEGYIYIADNTWHITLAELNMKLFFVEQKVTMIYEQLGENIFLPVTCLINTDIDVLGVNATQDYYASLKYISVQPNEKNEIEKKKAEPKSFEIKQNSNYRTEMDSLASKRDSVYWQRVRVVPLSEKEAITYSKKDSINQRIDSLKNKYEKSEFSIGDLLTGGRIGGGDNLEIRYEGLLRAAPEYNYVDGVWLGQKMNISTKVSSSTKLNISPYAYFAWSRRTAVFGGDAILDYAPKRLGSLKLSFGANRSEDFNSVEPDRIINSLYTLVTGRNKSFFYENNFVSLANSIEITNGLRLQTILNIAKRNGLSNTTDYTWGNRKKIKYNIFPTDRFDQTAYSVQLSYTPRLYYKMDNNRKSYVKSAFPTITLGYYEGLSGWQKNNSTYRRLELGIKQKIDLDYFSKFDYSIEGGGFIGNRKDAHFADYRHFNTSNTLLSLKSPFMSYVLLDNYEASTNRYWVNTAVNYTNRYIVLKRLPFLQGKMFTENLHLKTLYTPDFEMYTELGYSVDLMRMVDFGIFTSFRKKDYESFGIRASFSMSALDIIF